MRARFVKPFIILIGKMVIGLNRMGSLNSLVMIAEILRKLLLIRFMMVNGMKVTFVLM